MSINNKTLFFAGVLTGMLSTFLISLYYHVDIAQINLPKIIISYAHIAARNNKATAEINQDFKLKFKEALEKISPRIVLVNKGQVISNHKLIDYTDQVLAKMGLKDGNNK